MQAPEEDDGRGSVDGGTGSPNVPGGAVGPGDQDSTIEESLATEGAPQVEGTPQVEGRPLVEAALQVEGPPLVEAASQVEGSPLVEEASQVEEAAQVEAASQESGPAAVASTSHRGLGTPVSEFTLTVPFLSYLEAEVVHGYLMAGAETHEGMVQWDLRVSGCDLFIRLTAEDSDVLQISTASLLHRLSIAVQTMRHFVPPYCASRHSQNEH